MSPLPSPAPITTAERLALYLKAEAAILSGNQSYELDGCRFTKADLAELRKGIAELRQILSNESAPGVGGIRTTQVVF